jgi:hypothetical protein
MPASFTAFVDESGDEGFKFLPNEGGSSRWLVLSAVIFRNSNALAPVRILKEARELLNKEPKYALHFRNLKHEQRVAFTGVIAKEKFLTVSVLSYKPDIPDPETFQQEKNLLYKYLTRLLLERISWVARDRLKEGDGDGTVDLVFSDRAAMSYEDLRGYIDLLRQQHAAGADIRIHWPAINTEQIRAVGHTKLAGLQVADAVASGLFFAVNLNQYGHHEPGYLHALAKHIYRHKQRTFGYGLKLISNVETLKGKMPHLSAAFEKV